MYQIADDTYVAQRSFKSRRIVPPVSLTDEQLQQLPSSTLILFGDREVVFDPRKALSRLSSVAPQVKTDMLSDTGHDFFVSRASDVNRHIIDFIKPA